MASGCKSVHRFAQISLTLALSTLSLPSPAAPEDCIEQAGQATCKAPILVTTPWQYALCDDASSSLGRAATWCAVMGGTWGGGGCAGATPPSESTVYPLADAFERSIHSPCSVSGSDNGWLAPGGFLDSWNCWRGAPRYQSGIEIFNLREMPFSGQSYNSYTKSCGGTWDERVIALRTRSITTGCPEGYTLRTSRFTGQLECYRMPQVICPVPDLTKIEDIPPNDSEILPVTLTLEQTRGDGYAALTHSTKEAEQCLRGKIAALDGSIPYRVTGAARTLAYEKHLREVWDRMEKLVKLDDTGTPEQIEACAPLRRKVAAEKGCNTKGGCKGTCASNSHCLRHPPVAREDSTHVRGTAFDVSASTVDAVSEALKGLEPPRGLQDFLSDRPKCSLFWGGGWNDADPVHFQLSQ